MKGNLTMIKLHELIAAAREAREAHNVAARAEDDTDPDTPEREAAEKRTASVSDGKEIIISQIEEYPCATAAELATKLRFLAEEYDGFGVETEKLKKLALDADRLATAA
jgi:hypothetical protein